MAREHCIYEKNKPIKNEIVEYFSIQIKFQSNYVFIRVEKYGARYLAMYIDACDCFCLPVKNEIGKWREEYGQSLSFYFIVYQDTGTATRKMKIGRCKLQIQYHN